MSKTHKKYKKIHHKYYSRKTHNTTILNKLKNVEKKIRKHTKKHSKIFRKKNTKKMKGGVGSMSSYPSSVNYWEEGVSNFNPFQSTPLEGGQRYKHPLPASMPVSSGNKVWSNFSPIFD